MCLHGTLPQEVRSTRREEEPHLFGTVLVLVVAVAVGVLVFRLTDGGPEGSGASEVRSGCSSVTEACAVGETVSRSSARSATSSEIATAAHEAATPAKI